jgi:hypothetical protein
MARAIWAFWVPLARPAQQLAAVEAVVLPVLGAMAATGALGT